jgi:hypothetical protein
MLPSGDILSISCSTEIEKIGLQYRYRQYEIGQRDRHLKLVVPLRGSNDKGLYK